MLSAWDQEVQKDDPTMEAAQGMREAAAEIRVEVANLMETIAKMEGTALSLLLAADMLEGAGGEGEEGDGQDLPGDGGEGEEEEEGAAPPLALEEGADSVRELQEYRERLVAFDFASPQFYHRVAGSERCGKVLDLAHFLELLRLFPSRHGAWTDPCLPIAPTGRRPTLGETLSFQASLRAAFIFFHPDSQPVIRLRAEGRVGGQVYDRLLLEVAQHIGERRTALGEYETFLRSL